MSIKDNAYSIAEEFMNQIIAHRPSFLVAHDGYEFDNCVLSYYLAINGEQWNWAFESVSIKNQYDSAIAFRINIQGINNLDSLVYLRASRFTDFFGFSLAALAKDLQTTLKTSPNSLFQLRGSKLEEQSMFRYNCNNVLVLHQVIDRTEIVRRIFIWSLSFFRIEHIKTTVTTHSTYGEKKKLSTVSESDRERSQHLNPGPPSVLKDHTKDTYRNSNFVIFT